jgi:biopolymer transport protein ExbD
MLTSTMVTTALDLVLPKAKGKTDNKNIAVSINKELQFLLIKNLFQKPN